MLQQGLAGKRNGAATGISASQRRRQTRALQDLGPAPATGAVELHHVATAILILGN